MSYRSKPKRRKANTAPQRYLVMAGLYLFSFVIISAGAGLCLVRSPHQKSADFQRLAQYYTDQAQDQNITASALEYLLSKKHDVLSQALILTPNDEGLESALTDTSQKISSLKQGKTPNKLAQTMILNP